MEKIMTAGEQIAWSIVPFGFSKHSLSREEFAALISKPIDKVAEQRDRLKETNAQLIENLERLIDRVRECNYENSFPSAFQRAETALQKAKSNEL